MYVFQLVLVGHFVWRCQWRRISLSRFKSHVPGDKAFKSKVCVRVRERERERKREGEGERSGKGVLPPTCYNKHTVHITLIVAENP